MATAAAITAGGQLAGAGISSVGNKQAAKAQERSANRALQFERDREGRRRQEWEYGQQLARAQWDAYQANRAMLMQRYGLPVGQMPTLPQFQATPAGPRVGVPMGQPRPTPPAVDRQGIAALLGDSPQMAGAPRMVAQPQLAQPRQNIAGLLDPERLG